MWYLLYKRVFHSMRKRAVPYIVKKDCGKYCLFLLRRYFYSLCAQCPNSLCCQVHTSKTMLKACMNGTGINIT